MYPAEFNYYRVKTVQEAVEHLQANPEAKLLAGGHSLIPAMKLRLTQPPALIDIGRLAELDRLVVEGAGWHIGALTRHVTIAQHKGRPHALAEAAKQIGDPAVRNRGTIGGNIAHADPAADFPTVLLALEATIHTQGVEGKRAISADDFFVDLFETALQEAELITHITLPSWGAQSGSAYQKLPNPASGYAMVGVCVHLALAGEKIGRVRVSVGGLTSKARRCPSVEAALQGELPTEQLWHQASQQLSADIADDVTGDLHASANYRLAIAPELLTRALRQAAQRAHTP